MKLKPVAARELARHDIDDAIDHYPREAGDRVALDFIDAVEATYRRIAAYPATGSPRYAHELNLPGLRTRALKRFPHVVFYVELSDRIDVWRVLHAHRDIPGSLRAPAGG